ncbi:ergot alkaloid biosynthetic protein A [Paecilomyces variotii No. 5]|uniref:Ergot alkaloid biosynthetic protein A n=1 Tax=Byssochlamys spectabilis (strain No. 5 / NBRC 109023) TaxID=1356009 RepID=V5HTY6_BYSSN|nr:ergot alkaloid biosynthetic protein A [Paecilomyces variotii No. 5]
MTILVLGGKGKTASRLASLLHEANIPFLQGTSSPGHGSQFNQSYFNWFEEKSYENPFVQASTEGLGPISAVYLVGPPVMDMVPPMLKFVDFARSKGVEKFVLLSASTVEKGGHSMGEVHGYLDSLKGINYVALRPTWFMENLLEDPHLSWIKNDNTIYSATGDGKIPFISADDIARVAFRILKDWDTQKTEYLILGPELLSYDQIANILTSLLGRKITHVSLSEPDFIQLLQERVGLPPNFAEMLAKMEVDVKNGDENRLSNSVQEVTGVSPQGFHDFADRNKQHWASDGKRLGNY